MGDGDPQAKPRVFRDDAAPKGGTGSTQLGDAVHLLVPIAKLQVEPEERQVNIPKESVLSIHCTPLTKDQRGASFYLVT